MLRVLSVLSFLFMVIGILGLIRQGQLLYHDPLLIAIQTAAVLLMFWARLTFGLGSFHLAANPTEEKLVTNGPYRWIRHPIYTAVILFCLPAAIHGGKYKALCMAGLILLGALIRIFCEESYLRRRFPDYKDYAARSWRIIPGIF